MTHTTDILEAAFPRHTAKQLERGLGCAPWQAQEIIKTGRIPQRLWAIAERIIERALDQNEERIREARETLKTIRVQRMVGRSQDRLAAAATRIDGSNSSVDSEAEGNPVPALNLEGGR